MSLLDTGQMSERDARTVTTLIRSSDVVVCDTVAAAYHGRAWVPLGHDSWAEYCKDELARAPTPQALRREISPLLKAAGMPYRAIGAFTGISHNMVCKDLVASDDYVSLGKRTNSRSKHLDVISRVVNGMQAYDIALTEIVSLDHTITQERAARLRSDLLSSRKSIDRMTKLLKERI